LGRDVTVAALLPKLNDLTAAAQRSAAAVAEAVLM
jgi:hypothetical protein